MQLETFSILILSVLIYNLSLGINSIIFHPFLADILITFAVNINVVHINYNINMTLTMTILNEFIEKNVNVHPEMSLLLVNIKLVI